MKELERLELGTKRMQETIAANESIISKNNRRLMNDIGWIEKKTLEADNMSRRNHIGVINKHYNKLLKVYQWEPKAREALNKGWYNL